MPQINHKAPCKECKYFTTQIDAKPCYDCVDGLRWKNFRRMKPKLEASTKSKDFRMIRTVD